MTDKKTPESSFFVWFRLSRLILGLCIIGLGLWLFIRRYIDQPDQGGSGLIPLLVIFFGIFLAVSVRISKRKASELSEPTEQ